MKSISTQRATLEGKRDRLLEKVDEVVKQMRLLRNKCPHPNIVEAPTGKYCDDCGATSDNHKF